MAPAGPPLDLAPFLDPARVVMLDAGTTKDEALRRLAEAVASHPAVGDPVAFRRAILEREEVSSTGIGGGVAVPHAKLPSISGFVIGIGLCPGGIVFAARDQRPVEVLVMIAACDRERDGYLRVLAAVAGLLKDDRVRDRLRQAADGGQAVAALLRRPA